MISELIDKQDSFEIIRDQIAAILATETVSQQALAVLAAKDPDDWKLRIFLERTNPWEQFLDEENTDRSPLINVWYDTSTFPEGRGNTVERQNATGIFNIDCYGYGISEDDPSGGHEPGDLQSALETQRALRLVRNIIMAGEYTYLQLRGLVGQRWPQSITTMRPQLDAQPTQHVQAARIALAVRFDETSIQVPSVDLELISVDVLRTEDGEIVIEADYPVT